MFKSFFFLENISFVSACESFVNLLFEQPIWRKVIENDSPIRLLDIGIGLKKFLKMFFTSLLGCGDQTLFLMNQYNRKKALIQSMVCLNPSKNDLDTAQQKWVEWKQKKTNQVDCNIEFYDLTLEQYIKEKRKLKFNVIGKNSMYIHFFKNKNNNLLKLSCI